MSTVKKQENQVIRSDKSIALNLNVSNSREVPDELVYSLTQVTDDADNRVGAEDSIWTYWGEQVEFSFTLVDKTGLGLVFTNDQHGPFWIKAGSNRKTCPTNKFIATGFDVDVKDSLNFVVTTPRYRPSSANQHKPHKDFVYRVRITEPREPNPRNRDWDPVIQNGGGGHGLDRGGRGGRDR